MRWVSLLSLLAWSTGRIAWCAEPSEPPAPDTVPVASITLADTQGMPIADEVTYGRMIVVTTEKSVHGKKKTSLALKISAVSYAANPDKSVTVTQVPLQKWDATDGATAIFAAPSYDSVITIVEMVALDDQLAWQEIKIKCGNGSQPPPGPTPGPGPIPGPNPPPTPVASKLMFSVVEDPLQRLPDTAVVMNAMETWQAVRVDGHDFRFFSPRSTETKGKKAIADAMKANIPPPALVVSDLESGKVLDVVKLPSIGDLPVVFKKYAKGGGQ